MALSEADVQKQIRHMVAFIEQEANEKAEEIDAKAEEEFNIEKSRIVHLERQKLAEFYEKKKRQLELQQKIQKSTFLNKTRLVVLKAKEDYLEQLKADTLEQIKKIISDPTEYKKILFSLIMQSLVLLKETHVVLKCRKADEKIVEEVLKSVIQAYQENYKKDLNVSIDHAYLPDDSAGGIVVAVPSGKIQIDNTLKSRLDSAFRDIAGIE